MHRGYAFEHFVEMYFLAIDGKDNQMPIIGEDGKIARTFRVPNSGALAALKGDVRTAIQWLPKQIMVECKDRKNVLAGGGRIYHLDMDVVLKNVTEADAAGMLPVFAFTFKGSRTNRMHVILRHEDVKLLSEDVYLNHGYTVFKRNRKTYTLHKDVLDALAQLPKIKATVFPHGDQKYALMTWGVFDELLYALKEKALELHEHKG